MAVHRGRHFLPVDQSFNFISGRHKLSAFGFLKRFVDKEGVLFHLGSRELLPYPRRQRGTVSCAQRLTGMKELGCGEGWARRG